MIGKISNLLISVPQYIIVIVFIIRKDYKKALFYHLLFIVTSIAAIRAMFDVEIEMFSYSRLKIVGLVGVYQIISLILFFLIKIKYQVKDKTSLFYRFRTVIGYLGISATLIGLVGITFFDYFPSYLISNAVYIGFLFIHIDMLLRFSNDESFKKKMFENAIYLLIAAPIAVCICFNILGVVASYSTLNVIIQSELSYFSVVLLIALFYYKNIIWILIAFSCLCVNLITSGRGGEIMLFFIGITIFLVLLFTKNKIAENGNKIRVIRVVSVIIMFIVGSYFSIITFSDITTIKYEQFTSLFNIFAMPDNFASVYDISNSPYIRVSQILDILDNGLANPIFLFIGHGYGGYFTDSLHMFSHLDLIGGAYSIDVVSMGQFPRAHSSFPSTLLYNGLSGLFLILFLCIKYIKKIKLNFLSFAAIILFLYGFYFNLQLALTAVFILFASEYKIKI
jgi:hypothetical protein